MRRVVVAATAVAALTGCGGSSAAPVVSSSASADVTPGGAATSTIAGTTAAGPLAKPIVTRLPQGLAVGVGRAAVIQTDDPTHVIIAGGLVVGDTTTDVVQRVDLTTGMTTRLAPLAVPVHDTAGSSLPGVPPLVIGGGNSSEQSVVQALSGNAWHVVGHLPTTRSDLSTVSFAAGGGRVWVLGGYDGSTPAVATVLAGDGGGASWKPAGSLAVALRYAAAALGADGKVYLFGGEVSGVEKDTIQTWDPQTGSGSVIAHLPMALGHMSAVAVGGKFLLVGGRTDASSGAMTDRMWWFDPATRSLTDAGRLPYVVADAALVLGDTNNVYLVGGESPHPITSILKIQVNP